MKILFDQGTPSPLRESLPNHEITTAFERGWQSLQNGDKNFRYQQNLSGRNLAILVLLTTDWRLIRQHTDSVAQAIDTLAPAAIIELPFPPL